jgi:hypothetical protein
MKSTAPGRQSPEAQGAPRISGSSVRSLGGGQEKNNARRADPRIAMRVQYFRVVSEVIRGCHKKGGGRLSPESKGVPRVSGSPVRSLGSCQKKKHWRQAVPRSAGRAQNFGVVSALIRKWSKKETLAADSPQKRRIPSNLEVVSAVTRARVKGRRPVEWIT